jgi:lipoprotein-anchoring transpeptidase ErfK/SrfK
LSSLSLRWPLAGVCVAAAALFATAANAQPLTFAPAPKWFNPFAVMHQTLVANMHRATQPSARPAAAADAPGAAQASVQASLQGNLEEDDQPAPAAEQAAAPTAKAASPRDRLRRQVVAYPTNEAPGTIVIDTADTYLYLVLGNGKALRYGVGVGRQGFTWSGVRTVGRKAKWPDWVPPPQMLKRQPYLPRFVAGGPRNPLGARAMYLAGTVYRIHGTNAPSSIGKHMSSGCIRMLNADVIDLYERVKLGTKVVVLPDNRRNSRMASR